MAIDVVELGQYIADTGCTVRAAGQRFGIAKSTVHKVITRDLKVENSALWCVVQGVLQENKSCRHLRGGKNRCIFII